MTPVSGDTVFFVGLCERDSVSSFHSSFENSKMTLYEYTKSRTTHLILRGDPKSGISFFGFNNPIIALIGLQLVTIIMLRPALNW